jgi:hypothetical protein
MRLCEELDRAPEDMREGIAERAESMEKSITEKSQYPRLTDRMDNALRNMWSGLKKWDRDDEYLDDLFDGLDDVAEEMADLDASAVNAAPKGRETGDKSEELAKKYGGGTATGRLSSHEPPPPKNIPQQSEVPDPRSESAGPGAMLLSDILRRKEAAVGWVLDELRRAPLTIIDHVSVKSMAVADILNKTKSDRTQQLIRAAYYVGVLRGVKLLHSKLQNGD